VVTGFPPRALRGTTIVVTRAAARADELRAPLEALGAHVLLHASTRIETRDTAALTNAATRLALYDWVVLTSATAVQLLCDATEAAGVRAEDWAQTRVAVVGDATAASLRARGITPTVLPTQFVADALLEALRERDDIAGSRVLYPTAAGARHVLDAGLRTLGATVDRIEAYESVASDEDVAALRHAVQQHEVDLVTFAASSAVDAWVAALTPLHTRVAAVTIGPVTSQAARAHGIGVAAEAMPSTIDGLVAAVIHAVRADRDRPLSLSIES
jgi:uroporphyrinogen-III synthase